MEDGLRSSHMSEILLLTDIDFKGLSFHFRYIGHQN